MGTFQTARGVRAVILERPRRTLPEDDRDFLHPEAAEQGAIAQLDRNLYPSACTESRSSARHFAPKALKLPVRSATHAQGSPARTRIRRGSQAATRPVADSRHRAHSATRALGRFLRGSDQRGIGGRMAEVRVHLEDQARPRVERRAGSRPGTRPSPCFSARCSTSTASNSLARLSAICRSRPASRRPRSGCGGPAQPRSSGSTAWTNGSRFTASL